MAKRPFVNRLNELDPKSWLKFQKSWFIHAPPPRKKGVLRHPAKFPETLAQEFIEFFTKEGQTILDPMVGTGSSLVAALRAGRNSVGIELNRKYVELADQAVIKEREVLGDGSANLVNADMNEEGANMLMLQTRQALGTTSLSLAAQAAQSVLRLF